jgi:ATP-dependent 26S proteasome regulatory subunit
MGTGEKPDVSYLNIGGYDVQKQEMREAVELPLTHHDLYKQIGIDPPRGVLLWGPPGKKNLILNMQRHWQDYVGESCCSPHDRFFYSSRWK